MRKVIKQSGGLSLTELNVRFTWPYGEGKYSREIRDFKPKPVIYERNLRPAVHGTYSRMVMILFCVSEQSTAYELFRKTGRFTPPARSIPRFRKYNIEDFHFVKVLGKGSFGKVGRYNKYFLQFGALLPFRIRVVYSIFTFNF